jgi:hypothetical protein
MSMLLTWLGALHLFRFLESKVVLQNPKRFLRTSSSTPNSSSARGYLFGFKRRIGFNYKVFCISANGNGIPALKNEIPCAGNCNFPKSLLTGTYLHDKYLKNNKSGAKQSRIGTGFRSSHIGCSYCRGDPFRLWHRSLICT